MDDTCINMVCHHQDGDRPSVMTDMKLAACFAWWCDIKVTHRGGMPCIKEVCIVHNV